MRRACVCAYPQPVPTYEFRCRACGDTFTVSRPMSQSADTATCPAGHADTVRLLTVAAAPRGGSTTAPAPISSGGGGGCCGGGCCG